jgi:selenocysteine-specific elongation factor
VHIIGTAGHVDHGKSALVNALTGTNPDRWREEQLRGMTLDLGFARLAFDDGAEAGIVDVPGHERFLHNMLAGAAGMELLLLAVAADEGVMPQTVEHLQILRYLNVRRTVVVVTKIDVLPDEERAPAIESIRASLRNSIARDAPAVPVSSLTGEGLDDLRREIRRALDALPARDPDAPAYLPVDRVFALPGHGTIVTGTLMQGRIRIGESLALQPSGRRVRVRNLQSFGMRREDAAGGMRVAVNLPGVDVGEIGRGEMLVAPQFEPSRVFAVDFSPLEESLAILRRRNAVRAYIGSAEILGTLLLDDVPRGGSNVLGTLQLQRATVAYPGTAFVVRRLSPKNLLGGGHVRSAAAAEQTEHPESIPHEARIVEVLKAAADPLTPAAVAQTANLREEKVRESLAALAERGDVFAVIRPPAYAHRALAEDLLRRVNAHLQEQQRAEPWAMGVTSLALARAVGEDEARLVRLLTALADGALIAYRAGYFSTVDHVPKLTEEQLHFFEEAVPNDPASPFAPAALSDVVARVRQSRIPGIVKAFDTLIAKGALVKVNDDLYTGRQIASIRARVESFLRTNKQMTMAQFRDLIGTSRKYAVPLLEWFDAHGITVRSGDFRALRAHG